MIYKKYWMIYKTIEWYIKLLNDMYNYWMIFKTIEWYIKLLNDI